MATRKKDDIAENMNAYMRIDDLDAKLDDLDDLRKKGDPNAPSKEELDILRSSVGNWQMIPLAQIVDYAHHTFKVRDNDDMEHLMESIRINGMYTPPTVRKAEGGKYEVISGHRRCRAAKLLGMKAVICNVIEADDNTAAIMSVDSNLHRSSLLPSEIAHSYNLKLHAMQNAGLETTMFISDSQYNAMIAEGANTSAITVYRYRKLVKLIPALLELVDEKKISVNAGAELADIRRKEQEHIITALDKIKADLSEKDAEKLTISIKDAKEIAKASRSGLTEDKVVAILDGTFKPRKKKAPSVPKAIKEKNIKKFYPASIKKLSGTDKEAFIIECIEEYIKTHDKWNGMDIK